jgi:hypothetical protein
MDASDSGSSSGFSSDEDDALAPTAASTHQPLASPSAHVVHVDVIDEPEASELDADPASVLADISGDLSASCLEAIRPLLDAQRPSLRYEQYTDALEHLKLSWAAAQGDARDLDDDDDTKDAAPAATAAFRRACAAVFAQFHRAFPLTWELFAQWIDAVRAVSDKRRLFALAAADYWSVPLTLARLRFLHGMRSLPANFPVQLHSHTLFPCL